jgi:dTMP kinase
VSARPARGRLVTLEGIEGVGKSTHLEFVAGVLREAGHAVLATREPGGVPIGERIREVLLAGTTPVPAMTELLLMFAARAAHLEERILPALARGEWVVCDRFTDASYAYQGAGRGLGAPAVAVLETLVQGEFRPDLTLLLDADWGVTQARRERRGATDRFEREGEAFFARVRAEYLRRAATDVQRVRVIDAGADIASVRAALRDAVLGFCAKKVE